MALDSSRQASYPGSTNIWIDNTFTFTYSGLRYLAAHELGHVFGLDDGYIEGTFACNPNLFSVMDMGTRSGNTITGACDSVSKTTSDINDTLTLHQLNPMISITSWVYAPGTIAFRFWEPSWADSGYRMRAYRLVGNDWVWTGQEWYHTQKVGWASQYNTTYYIKGSQPSGYYWVCGWSHNNVLGNQYYQCSPTYHYLSP